MEKDILNRLNEFLQECEETTTFIYYEKEKVINILKLIINEVKEDNILLNIFKENVEQNWSQTNKKLINAFENILQYYGIKEGNIDKKTYLVNKGKMVVRKTIVLEQKQNILRELNGN